MIMKKLILALTILLTFSACSKDGEVPLSVNDKIVKTQSNGDGGVSSKYLIFTGNGTYEITDSIFNWNFHASDTYGNIKKGSCYKATIDYLSWRVPFLSMYENILEAEEFECTK